MSFSATTSRPSINSTVTVRFTGLLLLKPGPNGKTCEVGVHQTSTSPHEFQVMLIVNKPRKPLTFIRLLTGPLTGEFNIDVQPTTGFEVFAPTPEPFIRDNDSDELDYRWAVNMSTLHPGVNFNDGARPVARLNGGTLYTGNRTLEGLRPVLVQGTNVKLQHRIAADLAAGIELLSGDRIVLSWDESGSARSFELPRPLDLFQDPGTTYTIVLLNEPPGVGGDGHDEFAEYYNVLEVCGAEIPQNARFLLDFGTPSTDEIPCMPVLLNS